MHLLRPSTLAIRGVVRLAKGHQNHSTVPRISSPSQVLSDLSRDIRVEELAKKSGRSTIKSLRYPADLSKVDPVLDQTEHFKAENARKLSSAARMPEIPPDTTGAGQVEDETDLLAKATGLPAREIKSLIQRPLVIRRVVNQTRKGKQASMYALAVVGNGQGMIGYGEGKHGEQATATRKAITQAVKNMHFIQRYQNRTIYGDVNHKFHAVRLKLRARPPGFGIRTNHFIHEICRCAGIADISAKVWGSRTGMNVVKATIEALQTQILPTTIAKERGKRAIDVEAKYYGK